MKKFRIKVNGVNVFDFEEKEIAFTIKKRLKKAGVEAKILEITYPDTPKDLPHRDNWDYPQSTGGAK